MDNLKRQTIAHATTRLSHAKHGAPRLWIEGRKLAKAGFTPQTRYTIKVDANRNRLHLEIDRHGERIVSQRNRRGEEQPIVDIASSRMLAPISQADILRIDFETGRITIEPAASEMRRIRREQRTLERMQNEEPLQTGSVSTGLGVLSYALHKGLSAKGIESNLAFSVEIDGDYQELCTARNPVWSETTKGINMPLQEFAFDPAARDSVEEIDILEAGIPCTAHSLSGRAKKSLSIPEEDPQAGHLVAGFIAIIAAVNPTIVIVENVPQYADSASYHILVNQLREWGYDTEHTILKGEEHGCLEHRHRMTLVATSKGLEAQVCERLENLIGSKEEPPKIADILDDVPEDSPLWVTMSYLREKEERDIEAGKGFRMQILKPDDTKVGTIGRGYAKVRSTEPKLRHPTNAGVLRQFTPAEHARIKGIPEEMVADLPVTKAHEILGQSVLVQPFETLGKAIGSELLAWIGKEDRMPPRIANDDDLDLGIETAVQQDRQLALF